MSLRPQGGGIPELITATGVLNWCRRRNSSPTSLPSNPQKKFCVFLTLSEETARLYARQRLCPKCPSLLLRNRENHFGLGFFLSAGYGRTNPKHPEGHR